MANKRKLPNGTLIGLGPDKTGGVINTSDGKVIDENIKEAKISNIAVTEVKPTNT